MTKAKLALGMSMVVALFAFSATPALASWTNHGGKGASHTGEVTFTYEGGVIVCVSTEVSYTISALGVSKTITIKYLKCKAIGLEATVVCPNVELKQPSKEGTEKGKAVGSQISSECVVKAPGCEINIPTEGNKELETISMKKVGSNVEGDVEIKGITATAKGSACALAGITKETTKSATLKIPKIIDEGVGLE